MSDKTIFYRVKGSPHYYHIGIAGTWDEYRPCEQTEIAELCAEHYWNECNGFEPVKPFAMSIYNKVDGDPLASFEIDWECVPRFNTIHRKKS